MFYKLLDDVTIIELGSMVSAPFCAKILADQGAEVIKIEKPVCGDESRHCEPFLNDVPSPERSGLYLYLNMNKKGTTLNLETATGRKILAELLKNADVFIENLPPRKSRQLGIDYRYVTSINPSIVMTSITPFGKTGPYRDYKASELICAHMGGAGFASTRETDIDQEPIKLPAHLFQFQAGLSAAAATVGALFRRRMIGEGHYLDVSVQESIVQNLPTAIQRLCYGNQIVSRTDHLARAPFHILPCKDGYIHHAFVQEYQWRRFLEMMGNPDWADNQLFKDYTSRAQYWDGLKPLLLDWTMEHTMDEIYRGSQEKGAPVGAVHTAREMLGDRQLEARGFFTEVEHPETGRLKYPGVPYRFSEIPRETPGAAPQLGQHNEEIYGNRLGYGKKDLLKLAEAGII
jgi:crotonobetainyl-CoA:carnitine CoA-transferase CaiB-like acyl-CoA transferase